MVTVVMYGMNGIVLASFGGVEQNVTKVGTFKLLKKHWKTCILAYLVFSS